MGGIGGQLDLVTKNAVATIQNVASQLAQMVTYDVPNALGEALLASVPNISAATSGGANQQPIEVNFIILYEMIEILTACLKKLMIGLRKKDVT